MAAQSSEELQELFQFSLDANQLQDAESKAEALLAKNAELHGEIEKQRASQAEIYFYLQSKLDDNNQVIRKLEDQCATEAAAQHVLLHRRREQREDHLGLHLPRQAGAGGAAWAQRRCGWR